MRKALRPRRLRAACWPRLNMAHLPRRHLAPQPRRRSAYLAAARYLDSGVVNLLPYSWSLSGHLAVTRSHAHRLAPTLGQGGASESGVTPLPGGVHEPILETPDSNQRLLHCTSQWSVG
jgi:hypothetical protein